MVHASHLGRVPWLQVLGKALASLPRDQIIVSTKVGRYGPEQFDFSAERVTASVHESLQRLQIPYIDIIQCHDIEFGSLDQVSTACAAKVYSSDVTCEVRTHTTFEFESCVMDVCLSHVLRSLLLVMCTYLSAVMCFM